MAQELPRFLSLFGNYRPDPAIVQVLTDWQVEKAVVDKQTRALRVTLSCPLMPAPALCHRVETELAQAYQVDRAILDLREEPAYKEEIPLPEPPGEETLPPEIYEEVPVSIGEPAIQTQHMPEENAGPVSETFPTAMDPFQITEELRRKAMASITPANSAGKKMGKPPDKAGKMIFGQREPRGAVTPMSELTLDMRSEEHTSELQSHYSIS